MSDHPTSTDDATTSDLIDTPPRTRHRIGRGLGTGVLALIVLAAGLDLLGPRTGDTTADGAGYHVSVVYPQIARAGEPAPFILSIATDAEWNDTVRIRFCDTWFEHLDFQAWYPSPAAETSGSSLIEYEFDRPRSGDTLQITLDARIAPGQLGGRDRCHVSVLDQEDEPAVTADWTTWRMP